MYINSAGQFNFRRKLFSEGALVSAESLAPSSVNEPASGPSAPPWPWQVGRCIWVLARGRTFFPGRAGQRFNYIIGHNYHGHYLHAGGLSVNNYVRENKVCEVNVRE